MNDSEELKFWYNFIDGDLDALSFLFLHYAKGLVSYGLKIYKDEELVKDSIQEIFIQLIRNRHKLKRNEMIKGLIYRMLRNKIIDEIKLINRSKRIDNLIFNSNSSYKIEAEDLRIDLEEETNRDRMIKSALNQLSSHQKEAMFLKYSDGLSYELISQVMGISIASSRTLIYRALKQLKCQLTKNQLSGNHSN